MRIGAAGTTQILSLIFVCSLSVLGQVHTVKLNVVP